MIQGQLLRRNVKRSRGGLVFKAHRLVFHSTPGSKVIKRYWCFKAQQTAPAPHLAHPGGCAALRIVLVTVPCVSRWCEHFPNGFDLHPLRAERGRHFFSAWGRDTGQEDVEGSPSQSRKASSIRRIQTWNTFTLKLAQVKARIWS